MSRLSQSEMNERKKMFQQGLLLCQDCMTFKPIENFWKNAVRGGRFGNFGYRYYCKQCELLRRDTERNKNRYLKIRTDNTHKLVGLFGGHCSFPGCDYSVPEVLEFHHINPAEKSGSPKAMTLVKSAFNEALDEANKCCLLCPNHHREIETGFYQVEYVKVEIGYIIASVTELSSRNVVRRGATELDKPQTVQNIHNYYYRPTIVQPGLW